MSGVWLTQNSRLLQSVLDLYPLSAYDVGYLLNPTLLQFGALQPSTLLNAPFAQTADIWGDYAIKCTSRNLAEGNARSKAPTWKFVFDAGFKFHGATVPYIFGSSNSSTSTLGTQLKEYFISMIVNHGPNERVDGLMRNLPSKADIPDYSVKRLGRPSVLYVNDFGSSIPIGDPDDTHKCDSFRSRSDVFRN